MKKLFLCCLIVILLCLASCEQTIATGSLTVAMNESGAKNITPASAKTTVVKYEVTGTHSTDSSKTFSKTNLATKTVTVENLVVGTWNIVAKGYNVEGTLIAQSSSTAAEITKDQTTAVTLALNYLPDGVGSLSYSISWSENIDKIQKFLIEIEGMDPVTLLKENATLTNNTYELTGTLNDLASGQHDVLIKALDGNTNSVGTNINQRLDIYKGLTSIFEVTLNEGLYPPKTPVLSVASGEVDLNSTVTISTQREDAKIYYTTDGSDPATSATKTLYSGPVRINQSMTIKAVAELNDRLISNVASVSYTVPEGTGGITITDPFILKDLQILKTNLNLANLKEGLYLQSPTYKESADVSWEINGEEKTGVATLVKGANFITAIITIDGKDYLENTILTEDSLLEVILSDKLNVTSKVGLEMTTVFSEETTITGTTEVSSTNYARFGVLIEGLKVTLSPYEIGKFEVTQELFDQVMGFNPSAFKHSPATKETQILRPVEKVTWFDAVAFCNKLTKWVLGEDTTQCVYTIENIKKEDLNNTDRITSATVSQDLKKKGYRLPTEAEWECAARGGDPTDTTNWNYEYSGSDNLDDVAWNYKSSDPITHEVGKKNANSLGLYDMSGNVKEWCWDAHETNYYTNLVYENDNIVNLNNPTGPDNRAVNLVVRGGDIEAFESDCTVSERNFSNPFVSEGNLHLLGFRLCRTL